MKASKISFLGSQTEEGQTKSITKKKKDKWKLTEKKETAKGAAQGGIDETANGEIETRVPFGIEVVLRWDCSCVFRHCHNPDLFFFFFFFLIISLRFVCVFGFLTLSLLLRLWKLLERESERGFRFPPDFACLFEGKMRRKEIWVLCPCNVQRRF